MEKSPLERLMSRPDFKPFAGTHAFQVLKIAKDKLKFPPAKMDDVLKAVSSLGIILETEVAIMLALQDHYCSKCGDCCRKRGWIRLGKNELQTLAHYQKKSYKKLKEELRAQPLGDGTLRFRQPCRFLIGNLCSVYPARPSTCKEYPTNPLLRGIAQGTRLENCPISTDILAEIVVKRVLEEQMWRDHPEELKKMAEKRKGELSNLASLPQTERLKLLTKRYAKAITKEEKLS